MADITRETIVTAAQGLFSGRVREGCFFMQSHRDGECAKCRAVAAHDAELARQAGG